MTTEQRKAPRPKRPAESVAEKYVKKVMAMVTKGPPPPPPPPRAPWQKKTLAGDRVTVTVTSRPRSRRVTITVLGGGGVPVEGATVLIWDDNDIMNYVEGTTDASGNLVLNLPGTRGGITGGIAYHIQWRHPRSGVPHAVIGGT